MAKTVDRFLSGVKRRCIIPSSQPLLDDGDILEIADDVTKSVIVPLIMSLRQEFFDYIETEDLADDTAAYSIPYRAIGRTLRDLKLYDGTAYRDMAQIAPEDEHLYPSGVTPFGFYFRGDKIIVVPTPTSAGSMSLQKWYPLVPSNLVVVADAALVVSSTATTVTVSAAPSTIATNTVVDFIQGKSGNSILGMDATVTNVASTVYTFGAGVIPDDLVAGDYISVAQTTPVLQLPDEVHSLLETSTSKRILKAIGDFEGSKALEDDESEEMKNVKMLLEPRIQGENTVIINRRGLLRGARARYRKGLVY